MKIDFNEARVQACRSYNRLVSRLNDYIEDSEIRIDADDLEDCLNQLRSDLVMIAATSLQGNDDFACVVKQITMVDYNPDGEDND